ncbi:MAG: hypothetical protein MHM6MM_009544 [Cercozoa sp. M6MM]
MRMRLGLVEAMAALLARYRLFVTPEVSFAAKAFVQEAPAEERAFCRRLLRTRAFAAFVRLRATAAKRERRRALFDR